MFWSPPSPLFMFLSSCRWKHRAATSSRSLSSCIAPHHLTPFQYFHHVLSLFLWVCKRPTSLCTSHWVFNSFSIFALSSAIARPRDNRLSIYLSSVSLEFDKRPNISMPDSLIILRILARLVHPISLFIKRWSSWSGLWLSGSLLFVPVITNMNETSIYMAKESL